MNVLVTGASGYIGSLLSRKILEAGYNLLYFDVNIPDVEGINEIINNSNCSIFLGDLTNNSLLNLALKNCDVVIHLAGISDGRKGKENPELTEVINVSATKNLVKLAKQARVSRFLFASTLGVYGDGYAEILTEELNLNPIDIYSKSKKRGEEILKTNCSNDFATCSLRISMVYGLSIVTRFDFLLNQLIKLAVNNGTLEILGGNQKRPQIHVDDITDLFLYLIKIDSNLFNGNSYNVVFSSPSLNEICDEIKKCIPNIRVVNFPEKNQENSYIMSGDKITSELGFLPQVNYEEGIKSIIKHLKS